MKKIATLLLFITLAQSAFAQSTPNIPYQSLLKMNPSFAGSNGGVRNQAFGEIPASAKYGYNSYSFTNAFDCYLPSLKSGIGVSVNYERFGHVIRSRSANLTYARHFKVGEKLKVIPSVQAGYVLREFSRSWLYYTPGASGWEGKGTYSFGYGVLINYRNLYGGLSVSSVNYPEMAIFKTNRYLYTTYQFHASYNLNIAEDFRVNFSGQYFVQLAASQALISANALFYKHFLLGASYGNNVSGFNAGIKMDYFTAQISYRKYLGNLVPENMADFWQFTLSFNLRNKELRHSVTNFEAW